MSAKDLKNELRELRKSHPDFMPVSKLKKSDVSQQIERLKKGREETPSAPIKKSKLPVKEAKKSEFPVKPVILREAVASKKVPVAPKKKESRLDRLIAMMDQMSESEDET
jgi:hypothetical protein